MKPDVRPKRPLEEIARDIELRRNVKREQVTGERVPASNANGEGRRGKIIAAVACIAVVFGAGWGIGHASPSSAWARAGVGARVPRVDAPEPGPDVDSKDAEALPDGGVDDDAPPDGGSAHETEGDALADLLAEAAARAKLVDAAAAAVPDDAPSPDVPDDAHPRAAAPAAPAPTRPLGSATRMRQTAERLIAICQSGHAAEVQTFAAELLQDDPPPWLAKRIQRACFGTTAMP